MAKAKTKIYFWLKVDKRFFENIFIKRLKNMAGGYTMTVIYIRLMLESLESDCILYYEGYFDSLVEELALKLDVQEDDVAMTLAYFTQCGLIQIDTDGNVELPQAKALIESESNWAKYKRVKRKSEKTQQKLDNVQPVSNQCPTEIEIEKDININKELNIKLEEDIREGHSASDDNSEFNIYQYYQERIGVLDGYQVEKLKGYIEFDNLEIELVKRAIDRSADNSKRSFGYVNTILKNWAQNGVKTIAQQDEEQRGFEERKNNKSDEHQLEERDYLF